MFYSPSSSTDWSLSRDNPTWVACAVSEKKERFLSQSEARKDDCLKTKGDGIKGFPRTQDSFYDVVLPMMNLCPFCVCVHYPSFMMGHNAQRSTGNEGFCEFSDFIDMQNKEFPSSIFFFLASFIMHENLFHFEIINPIDFSHCRMSFSRPLLSCWHTTEQQKGQLFIYGWRLAEISQASSCDVLLCRCGLPLTHWIVFLSFCLCACGEKAIQLDARCPP